MKEQPKDYWDPRERSGPDEVKTACEVLVALVVGALLAALVVLYMKSARAEDPKLVFDDGDGTVVKLWDRKCPEPMLDLAVALSSERFRKRFKAVTSSFNMISLPSGRRHQQEFTGCWIAFRPEELRDHSANLIGVIFEDGDGWMKPREEFVRHHPKGEI